MRLSRSASLFVLLVSLSCLLPSGLFAARESSERRHTGHQSLKLDESWMGALPSSVAAYHGGVDMDARPVKRLRSEEGGIKEDIPQKYKARYQQWKTEFLSTELGRSQWATFENNAQVSLTIKMTRENPKGAGTGQYKWDDSGQLVAATITLGSSLHEGYPNPIYYPVMNSLATQESSYSGDGHVLAAAKIAHEFGHLTRTSGMDHALYERQNQLMPVYNKILLSNGRNVRDPKLLALVEQMGGTPVEIWEDREYWGETNAMLFLRDRFAEENIRCALFGRIKLSVNLYAKNYTERFLKIAQSSPSLNRCGWQ